MRDPISTEKDVRDILPRLVNRFLLAREAERLLLGEDEESRQEFRRFADSHLRQMTFERYFKDKIMASSKRGYMEVLQGLSGHEAIQGTILEGILLLGRYRLLVQPTEQLRRRWLRSP